MQDKIKELQKRCAIQQNIIDKQKVVIENLTSVKGSLKNMTNENLANYNRYKQLEIENKELNKAMLKLMQRNIWQRLLNKGIGHE